MLVCICGDKELKTSKKIFIYIINPVHAIETFGCIPAFDDMSLGVFMRGKKIKKIKQKQNKS